jgi:Predicted CoA-binding protein
MNHDDYSDDYIRSILTGVKTIAVVGASDKEERPSNYVTRFLAAHGYRMFAVNPAAGPGATIAGAPAYASLADIPEPIDMVDVFRNSEAAAGVVAEALALATPPKVIWLQLGVRNDEAAEMAEAAGVKMVMDRCPKIEIPRLGLDPV